MAKRRDSSGVGGLASISAIGVPKGALSSAGSPAAARNVGALVSNAASGEEGKPQLLFSITKNEDLTLANGLQALHRRLRATYLVSQY